MGFGIIYIYIKMMNIYMMNMNYQKPYDIFMGFSILHRSKDLIRDSNYY
jgi:hypothetical protein